MTQTYQTEFSIDECMADNEEAKMHMTNQAYYELGKAYFPKNVKWETTYRYKCPLSFREMPQEFIEKREDLKLSRVVHRLRIEGK